MTYRAIIILIIVLLINASLSSAATCVTPSLWCELPGTAPPGTPCYCNTPYGPLQGNIVVNPATAQPTPTLPNYCCTPAGRFGPYPNNNTPVGGPCYSTTPFGVVSGQACY